ncbi:hypothetical protein Terro_0302 [Terriglobus roseus DSM 18391]|uniref:Uncharacterized protein n=1 Tax=Terriglobus roseus (strain DSM 18391 / NRRL B-41598 / KBS 63) TaxID=926566 RepID=I3ZBN3_TERRK|nr:hypothetical protein [Terriglobus roseus]AFL86651.1 hypothetical protein Terro_0302 [Terriglobus roseus DSM 18391]
MCISDTYSLAERKTLGGVSMCSCGTIHLTVGGITIRLEPEAFGEMVRMCQDAADRLTMSAEMTPGHSRLAN